MAVSAGIQSALFRGDPAQRLTRYALSRPSGLNYPIDIRPDRRGTRTALLYLRFSSLSANGATAQLFPRTDSEFRVVDLHGRIVANGAENRTHLYRPRTNFLIKNDFRLMLWTILRSGKASLEGQTYTFDRVQQRFQLKSNANRAAFLRELSDFRAMQFIAMERVPSVRSIGLSVSRTMLETTSIADRYAHRAGGLIDANVSSEQMESLDSHATTISKKHILGGVMQTGADHAYSWLGEFVANEANTEIPVDDLRIHNYTYDLAAPDSQEEFLIA